MDSFDANKRLTQARYIGYKFPVEKQKTGLLKRILGWFK
jgi:hypothetical protein